MRLPSLLYYSEMARFSEQIERYTALFPADSIWNVRVDTLPLDPLSATYIETIGADTHVHPDFGSGEWPPNSGAPIGIPFVVVPASQPLVPVGFLYDEESDPGPYPIPPSAPIEGGPTPKPGCSSSRPRTSRSSRRCSPKRM